MGKLILKLVMRASCIVLSWFHLWLTRLQTKCVFLVMINDTRVIISFFAVQIYGLSYILFYYISKLVRALVNTGRSGEYGPLKFKVVFVAKLLRDLSPHFLNLYSK